MKTKEEIENCLTIVDRDYKFFLEHPEMDERGNNFDDMLIAMERVKEFLHWVIGCGECEEKVEQYLALGDPNDGRS